MEMGLGPALTKESWRPRFIAASKECPDVMLVAFVDDGLPREEGRRSTSRSSAKAVGVPMALPSLRALSRSASNPTNVRFLGIGLGEDEVNEVTVLVLVVVLAWRVWEVVVVVVVVGHFLVGSEGRSRFPLEKLPVSLQRPERPWVSAKMRRCFDGGEFPASDEDKRRREAFEFK